MITALFLVFISLAQEIDLRPFPSEAVTQIREKIPKVETKKLTGAEIDTIIKALMATGLYDGVEVAKRGGKYRFKLILVRKLVNVDFINNAFVSDTDLFRETELEIDSPYDNRAIVDAIKKIQTRYGEEGYLSAKVEANVQEISETEVGVNFEVIEGGLTEISNVEFELKNDTLRNELMELVETHLDRPATQTRINQLVEEVGQYLLEKKYYTSRLERPQIIYNDKKTRVTLKYVVSDPYEYKITFVGNTNYSGIRDDVVVTSTTSSPSNFIPEILNRAKARYLERGYARVKIKEKLEENSRRFTRSLRIEIKEGPQIKIDAIEITGRYSQPAERYIKFLRENSSSLVEDGFYNKADLENGYRNLGIDLQNQGYLQSRIISSSIRYNKEKTGVTLKINLDEGPLTRIQTIEFEGISAMTREEMFELLDLKPGSALRLNRLEEGIEKIQRRYFDMGYLEMRLASEKEDIIRYRQKNTLANLQIEIVEGPKIIAQSIIIEGTKETQDFVVLKEIEFGIGDVLTPEIIAESTRRLQRTGLFASIQIDTVEKNTPVSRRTVLITVSERKPGLFNIGGGVNTQFGGTVRGFSGITYRNLQKRAHVASVRTEVQRIVTGLKDDFFDKKVVFGYIFPYLLDSRLRSRLSVDLGEEREEDKFVFKQVLKGTVALEQDFTSSIRGVFNVHHIENSERRNIPSDDRAIGTGPRRSQDSTLIPKRTHIRSIGPRLEFDYRDHPFVPTKGSFTRISLEYGDPIFAFGQKAPKFLRGQASYTHYWNFTGQWVWANSASYGRVENLDPNEDAPLSYFSRGFFLGGQTTLRGFGRKFPDEAQLGINESEDYNLQSNASTYMLKSEVRYPIYGSFGGAFFYDGGIVKIGDFGLNGGQARDIDFCPDKTKRPAGVENCRLPWRHNAGLAFRYITPVGAASAEVAWKLDKQPGEDELSIIISFGTF